MDHSVKAAQENILIGRIIGLRMFRVTEFGTRVSFKIESAERCCVTCCAAGDVAQEFIAHSRPIPPGLDAFTPFLLRDRIWLIIS